jgi:hypothetical protein
MTEPGSEVDRFRSTYRAKLMGAVTVCEEVIRFRPTPQHEIETAVRTWDELLFTPDDLGKYVKSVQEKINQLNERTQQMKDLQVDKSEIATLIGGLRSKIEVLSALIGELPEHGNAEDMFPNERLLIQDFKTCYGRLIDASKKNPVDVVELRKYFVYMVHMQNDAEQLGEKICLIRLQQTFKTVLQEYQAPMTPSLCKDILDLSHELKAYREAALDLEVIVTLEFWTINRLDKFISDCEEFEKANTLGKPLPKMNPSIRMGYLFLRGVPELKETMERKREFMKCGEEEPTEVGKKRKRVEI